MSKTYDLSNKSDMKKFEKDLDAKVLDIATESIKNGTEIEYECPNCHKQISIHVGKNVCPYCNLEIEATI